MNVTCPLYFAEFVTELKNTCSQKEKHHLRVLRNSSVVHPSAKNSNAKQLLILSRGVPCGDTFSTCAHEDASKRFVFELAAAKRL